MRIHDTRPRAETHYPDATSSSWGHDYGTRGGEALERPFIDDEPVPDGHGSEIHSRWDDESEGFLHRAGSWIRNILR
jgi:hypothetical protein